MVRHQVTESVTFLSSGAVKVERREALTVTAPKGKRSSSNQQDERKGNTPDLIIIIIK